MVEVTHGASRIVEAVADKGYHKSEKLARLTDRSDSHRYTEHSSSATNLDLRTYIAEPDAKHKRRWTDKPPTWEAAYRGNRRRIQGSRGKSWQRRRSEMVERSFAHVCETGGLGAAKPRAFAAFCSLAPAQVSHLRASLPPWSVPHHFWGTEFRQQLQRPATLAT